VSVSSAKAFFHQKVSAHRLRKKRWEGTAEATQFFTHQSKVVNGMPWTHGTMECESSICSGKKKEEIMAKSTSN